MSHRTLLVALGLLLSACDGVPVLPDAGSDAPLDDAGLPDAGPPDTGTPPPFELTSEAYAEGGTIPLRQECSSSLVPDGPGENISPPLAWTAGPAATMSYAIVMRDRDAGNLVHWVLYDLPADVRTLPENVRPGYAVASPMGAHQAEIQGSSYFGYFGPCSPGTVNTYEITVHALDTPTLPGVDRTTSEDDLAAAVEAASIASASLRGES